MHYNTYTATVHKGGSGGGHLVVGAGVIGFLNTIGAGLGAAAAAVLDAATGNLDGNTIFFKAGAGASSTGLRSSETDSGAPYSDTGQH